ncbi:hypothetical protein ACQP00_33675 [Dactylosporangium sp. CS-047395]|uniref:hypothetical protein n=1 Tax=Dactylosporangium sp. CS-047395 TaxID=3239936 RepID=UPI003D94A403
MSFTDLTNELMDSVEQPGLAEIERRTRRRRRRRALRGGLTGAAAVVAVVAGLALLRPGPAPAPEPAAPGDGTVHWAGTGDAGHVYAIVQSCASCPAELLGSDDGGDTWTVRTSSVGTALVVRGPRTLSVTIGVDITMVSVDGGRTWQQVTLDPAPAAGVPDGGWLQCADFLALEGPVAPTGETCIPTVIDPAARTARPLADPPEAFAARSLVRLPAAAGWWLLGNRDGEPAVAVSQDQGAHWVVTRPFGPVAGSAAMSVTRESLDGRRAAWTVVWQDAGSRSTSRQFTTDGGVLWSAQREDAVAPLDLPPQAVAGPDGRWTVTAGDTIRITTDGVRYEELRPRL